MPTEFYSSTFTALGGTITSHRVVNSTSEFTFNSFGHPGREPNRDLLRRRRSDPGRTVQSNCTQFGDDEHNHWMSPFSDDEALLATYAGAAGAAAENDYAAMGWRRIQDMPGWTAFLAAYQAANFPNVPDDPGMYGAFAYDAARIIIAAIDRADSINPTAIRNEIAATRNHRGVVGTYQGFDAYGDVIPQWAWLERYQNGQWGIVQPTKIFLPAIRRHPGP